MLRRRSFAAPSVKPPLTSCSVHRLERNRESARKCRKKRKQFVGDLQSQVETLGVSRGAPPQPSLRFNTVSRSALTKCILTPAPVGSQEENAMLQIENQRLMDLIQQLQ